MSVGSGMRNIEHSDEHPRLAVEFHGGGVPCGVRALRGDERPNVVEAEYVAAEHLRGTVGLLREVANVGVVAGFSGHVEVQIDRATWDALATYRAQP
jgi:hypothetical protein